jgi:hypothetical protein
VGYGTAVTDDAPSDPTTQTFPFRFDPRYRVLAAPFGISPARAEVRLGDGRFVARFGPWTVDTPLTNVAGAEVTGPYGMLKTAGPAHLSFADRGLTFASNGTRGVCVRFREPVPGISPSRALLHPALTVTVADVEGLHRAVLALV